MAIDCREPSLALWIALMRAHAALTRTVGDQLEAEHDVPLAWHEVLVQLEISEGQLRMQTLAERVLLSRSGLTRLCDRMESAGMIKRVSCAHDRRGTFAAITDQGRHRLRRSWPQFLATVNERFENVLTPDERATFLRILNKLSPADTPVV